MIRTGMKVVMMTVAVAAFPVLAAAQSTAKTTLTIKGMTCGGCVAAVKLQLKRTEGVRAYEVSLDKAEADVTCDAAKTTPAKIAESVSKTGFQARVKDQKEDKKQDNKATDATKGRS